MRGIALVTAILMAALLTVLIGTALFIASRGLFVTSGEERFASAFEAAEGGIEGGMMRIRRYLDGLDDLGSETYRIGSYSVSVKPQNISVYARGGFNLRFASAYLGLGYSEQGGALGQVFLISSDAKHPRGQRGIIEALRIVPIGFRGGD